MLHRVGRAFSDKGVDGILQRLVQLVLPHVLFDCQPVRGPLLLPLELELRCLGPSAHVKSAAAELLGTRPRPRGRRPERGEERMRAKTKSLLRPGFDPGTYTV